MNKLKETLGNFSAFVRRNSSKVLTVAMLALASSSARAVDPTTVEGIATSAGALIDTIKPIVIGAVFFGIMISLVKMVRRK